MKALYCFMLTSLISTPAWSLPDTPIPPELTKVSASYAKAKARNRAYETEIENVVTQKMNESTGSSSSCDLNVGNVIIEDDANAPNEVVVIIEGDIFQENNCQ